MSEPVKIEVVPDAIYIKMEIEPDGSLTSHLWSATDSYDLQCLVRGMLSRLSIDQADWAEVGQTLIDKDNPDLKTMSTKGNA